MATFDQEQSLSELSSEILKEASDIGQVLIDECGVSCSNLSNNTIETNNAIGLTKNKEVAGQAIGQ